MSMAASMVEQPGAASQKDAPEFVAGCRRCDPDCFTLLVRQTEPRVRRLLARLVADGHDVDELVQETYLRAWRSISQFRGVCLLSTWITRIAVNVACNWRRDHRRQETGHSRTTAALPARAEIPAEPIERAFHEACLDLPPELRLPFVLHQGEGLSYREVAEVLDWPLGTVMSRLHRARTALLTQLQDRLAEVKP